MRSVLWRCASSAGGLSPSSPYSARRSSVSTTTAVGCATLTSWRPAPSCCAIQRPDDDRLLSSLAQFDILANLAVISTASSVQSAGVYPHFRRFYGFRSDPAVVALLENADARREIYPKSDAELAQALRDLGQIGSGEFFYVNGWDEYEDERIRSFLAEHPSSSAS